MRTFYHLFFRRRLNPRTIYIIAGIAVTILFVLLIVLTYSQVKNKKTKLVVNPPVFGEQELDRSELSVTDPAGYPLRGNSGEILLGLGALSVFSLSPDWNYLATASDLGVFLWDITQEQPTLLKWFRNEKGLCRSLAFSPDGKRLAQGNHDGSLTIWYVGSGEALLHIRAQSGHFITGLAFSPDGNQLATGNELGHVKTWDMRTGERTRRFLHRYGECTVISFSPDGQYLLASNARVNSITIWELKSNRMILSKQSHPFIYNMNFNLLTPLAMFSPDGSRILSRCSNSATQPIVIWDVNLFEDKCEIKRETNLHFLVSEKDVSAQYQNASFSPDGKQILIARDTAQLWNAETGALIRTYPEDSGQIDYAAYSPDGLEFLTFHSQSNLFKFRTVETGAVTRSFYLHSSISNRAFFLPDGQHILSESVNAETYIWDLNTGKRIQNPSLQINEKYRSIAYSSDGQRLLTQVMGVGDIHVMYSNTAPKQYRHHLGHQPIYHVWDVRTGEMLQTIRTQDLLRSIVLSKDGSKVIGSTSDGLIHVWDVQTGKITTTIEVEHWSSIHYFVLGSDDKWIAVYASQSNTIDLWDIQIGVIIQTLECPLKLFYPVHFSSDGNSILTGNTKGHLQMIEIESGETHEIPCGKIGFKFTPDFKYLVFANETNRLTLWDLERKQEVGSVKLKQRESVPLTNEPSRIWPSFDEGVSMTPQIRYIDISPEGKQILASCTDGCIRIWEAPGAFAPKPVSTLVNMKQ